MPTLHQPDTQEARSTLSAWLTSRLPDREVSVSNVRIPDSGYSGETIIFDVHTAGDGRSDATWVARLEPRGAAFFFDTDIAVHYKMLVQLARTQVPAPRPLWFEQADASDFGRPFFVMTAIAGRPVPESPHYAESGWVAELSPHEQTTMYRAAIRHIAAVHQVDWESLDLSFLPVMSQGGPGVANELALFEEFSERTLQDRRIDVIDEARRWLVDHAPRGGRLRLSWGDPKFANFLYTGLEPSGLLDWELATVAPPESDVAFWLVYHDSVTAGAGHPDLPGFPGEDTVLKWYEEESDIRLDSLEFYKFWHRYRIAVMTLRLADLLVAQGKLRPDPDRPLRMRAMRELARCLG